MTAITDVFKVAFSRNSKMGSPLRKLYRQAWHASNARKYKYTNELFQSLSQHLAEDPCVAVPEFEGEFYIDARSALFQRIIRDGVYEPELTALCRKYVNPERDVLDIGANVGFHSVLFGRLLGTGKAVAVEPTSRAANRLERNLARNKVQDRVTIHKGAIADTAGQMTMKTIAGREEYSTLGQMSHPSVSGVEWQEEVIQTLTLDDLVEQHKLDPGFVKVDVEGAEHMVFSQASRLLSTNRPVIIAELSETLLRSNGSSAREVVDLIAKHDYDITDPLHPGVIPGKELFGEILCIPR